MAVLVIADDLSGAAEIAALGVRYGLDARIARHAPDPTPANLHVLDIDARQSDPIDAAERLARALRDQGPTRYDWCYLKVDSVLRGPVLALLRGMTDTLGKPRAVLVPQNPTRRRTIADGTYHIDGTPVHLTAFAGDPDFAATGSSVDELLGIAATDAVTAMPTDGDWPDRGVIIPDGADVPALERLAARVDAGTVAAGSSDFFECLLRRHGHRDRGEGQAAAPGLPSLVVSGSAAAISRAAVQAARDAGVPVCDMPPPIFDRAGADPGQVDAWVRQIEESLDRHAHMVVTIGNRLHPVHGTGARLVALLAEVVTRVCDTRRIATLYVEGGATGAALSARFAWDAFAAEPDDTGRLFRLRPDAPGAPLLAIKPGSYPWPAALCSPAPLSPTGTAP